MLSREHRLVEGAGFTSATRGRRAAGRGLVVHLARASAPAAAVGAPRVGLIVGRGVGGSVVRNRVKRRLRHLLRTRVDDLADGAVLAVRALPASARMSWVELGADLDRCLTRLGSGT